MKKKSENIKEVSYTSFEDEIKEIEKLLAGEVVSEDSRYGRGRGVEVKVKNDIPMNVINTNYAGPLIKGTEPVREKFSDGSHKMKEWKKKELKDSKRKLEILFLQLEETKEPWYKYIDVLKCLQGFYAGRELNKIYRGRKRLLLTEKNTRQILMRNYEV